MADKITKSDAEWRASSRPRNMRLRARRTPSGRSPVPIGTKIPGVYTCACCGQELFSSDTKFDSGTGWPSFTAPMAENAVETETDRAFSCPAPKLCCSRCEAHLGHVFPDGPAPTGLAVLASIPRP